MKNPMSTEAHAEFLRR